MQGSKSGLGDRAYPIRSPNVLARASPVTPKMRRRIGLNTLDRNSDVLDMWDSVKGSKYGGLMNDNLQSIRGSD
jgi:hypothetical protein